MIGLKYGADKIVYEAIYNQREGILRIGFEDYAIDLEGVFAHPNHLQRKFVQAIRNKMKPEEVAKLFGGKIVEIRKDHLPLDLSEFEEIHFRWDVIKYKKGNRWLYQRRGSNEIIDEHGNIIFR
jgi:hypothetical protein